MRILLRHLHARVGGFHLAAHSAPQVQFPAQADASLEQAVVLAAGVAGRIAQAATTSRRVGKGSKRRTQITTRCRVSRNATAAGTYALKCNLGSKGRKAIKQGSLRLTVKTTLTATSGTAVSNLLKLTIKRKR